MNAAAGRLPQVVIGAVIVIAIITGAALALVAPRFLLIEPELSQRTLVDGMQVGIVVLIAICTLSWVQIRRYRFTLRALGLGSRTVEPEELLALSKAPAAITQTAAIASVAGALITLIPPFRTEGIDVDTRVSLVALAISFCATASLALYVIIRRRVARAMVLAPEDAMHELMLRVQATEKLDVWMVRRVLVAVLTPVALVGFGVALLVHAHIRAFEARSRLATATAIAQSSLEPVPGPVPNAGEMDAARAGRLHGYAVRLYPEVASYRLQRKGGGEVTVTIPLDVGYTTISFQDAAVVPLTATSIIAALLATLLAATLGARVGRSLSRDLAQATRQVRMLGTETVLGGLTRVARPARFAVVNALGEAIEKLADRFRVFASTQEKAIAAREAARRMRGLLFASVSHDLKSCLNAILGFADLVNYDVIGAQQEESLDVIKLRGRELLGLIQTILDGARVEAGQIVLQQQTAVVHDLVREAIEATSQTAPADAVPIINEATVATWSVSVDPERVVDAITALLRHALRTTTGGVVHVRAVIAPSGRDVLIDINVPTRAIPAARLMRLLMPDGESTMPRSAGGLALGLSLARSLVVMHGGTVEALDTVSGVVLRVSLPLVRGE